MSKLWLKVIQLGKQRSAPQLWLCVDFSAWWCAVKTAWVSEEKTAKEHAVYSRQRKSHHVICVPA